MIPTVPLSVTLRTALADDPEVIAAQNKALEFLARKGRIAPGLTVDRLPLEGRQPLRGELKLTLAAGVEVEQADIEAIRTLANHMTVESVSDRIIRRSNDVIEALNRLLRREHYATQRPNAENGCLDGFAASFEQEADGHRLSIVGSGNVVETFNRLRSLFLEIETHNRQPVRQTSQPHTGSLVPSM